MEGSEKQRRVEVLAALLLALAAVATAWSTYQSQQWRGKQAADYSKASAARIQSSEASTRAGQLTQVDIATFIQWVDAATAGDAELAHFYRRRFRPEFRSAFRAWLAANPRGNPSAPLTPFASPEYRVAEAVKSDRLNTAAGVLADSAGVANQRADDYVLAVVLFATSLFFAGISTKLRSLRLQEGLLAVGWAIFLGASIWIATSPTTVSM